MSPRTGVVAVVAVVVAASVPSARSAGAPVAPSPAVTAAVTYAAPVPPLVVRPFEAPVTPFGPGHRGVDLATRSGQAVRSAATGVVTFAGAVAARGVVVVQHSDGVSTEYEPITPAVSRGTSVRGGQVLGHVHGRHGACVPGGCLHWGARRDGAYFDPLLLLAPLGPVRLLPWRPD
jgi:murein DD-endopeptidase MepM/ murein hydrolase activator NlpD